MCCKDFEFVVNTQDDLIVHIPDQGWVLSWKLISEQRGYVEVENYGVVVTFCPFCGEKLTAPE